MAHSAPIRDDKSGYRKFDTEEVRNNQDSLLNFRSQLVKSHNLESILEIEKIIDTQIQDALKSAIDSPEPKISELESELFFS